jgi:DNA invertase Pin-like site-specific DNA recombinase
VKINDYRLCETIFDRTKLRKAVGSPLLYSQNAKGPQKRVIYHRVVEMLEEDKAINKIAIEVNITRQTVYRIKHDKGLY